LKLKIPSGKEMTEWVPDLLAVCHYRGEALPESLSFTLDAVDADKNHLAVQKAFTIDFSRVRASALSGLPSRKPEEMYGELLDIDPKDLLEPYRKACARDQILEDNERVRIRLVALGEDPRNLWDPWMTVVLSVENKTDGLMPVTVEGVSIDGVFEPFSGRNHTTLPAGMTHYFGLTFSDRDFPGLSGIKEIALLILTDTGEASGTDVLSYRGGKWYPVVLEEASSRAYDPDLGKIVFEEAGVKIGFRSFEQEESFWNPGKKEYQWNLTIVNETDQHIDVALDRFAMNGVQIGEKEVFTGPTLYCSDVPSNSVRYAYISMIADSETPEPGSFSFTVTFRSMGAYNGEPLHISKTVVELRE
ncbi:MAG: hypothetical protein IKG97_06925, partial [Lachnospiraceae bacterium]|nr:hypothetical protein [Lachnospiraceae bacterium]